VEVKPGGTEKQIEANERRVSGSQARPPGKYGNLRAFNRGNLPFWFFRPKKPEAFGMVAGIREVDFQPMRVLSVL
jgi:hypothetical protein